MLSARDMFVRFLCDGGDEGGKKRVPIALS
jgi:hypothetical protein